ncbi:transcription-repair coupling factor [Ketobacter sp.]|uniref:transcription-repair coupling factor n=1 Tax=Ketobacter sp. TaxID=2083498 RepID=UPI000F2000B7|nr:transcription-repair coupling factor [Ketobacter sp.]RLT93458.1 MAG: transcription-repair coupling factor [Ketobacter sp.]
MSIDFLENFPTKSGDQRIWSNLWGSGQAWALAQVAKRHRGLTLVVTANTQSALQLEQEVPFYAEADIEVLTFPDWETLPYDSFSPHQDIISQRLATLSQLPSLQRGILVVPVSTLMHRIAPPSFMAGQTLILDVGQKFDLGLVRRQLEQAGYRAVDMVLDHGEYAVRGAILDLFPMGSQVPYRIDLFDDEIDTLRAFDPETQRSIEKVEQIRLLPAKEFPLHDDAIARFKERFKQTFDVDPRSCPVYQDISAGIASAGIEYYLPLFFQNTATVFDFLPDNTLLISAEGVQASAEHFWVDCNNRYEELRYDRQRPILPPTNLFLADDELNRALKQLPRIQFRKGPGEDKDHHSDLPLREPPALPINAKANNPLLHVEAYCMSSSEQQQRLLFVAESAGRRDTLLDLLKRIRVTPKPAADWPSFTRASDPIMITVAPLSEGLVLSAPAVSVITESQLFGNRVMQRRRRKRGDDNAENVIRNLTELNANDPVVHIDHGVGRYKGLQTLELDGQQQEFLTLEYANEAKLYVPVSSLHLISRYSGASDALAPLHRLGTDQWSKEKRKAAEQIHDTAAELLNIYARRAAKPGHAFDINRQDYEAFCEGFPFEETPDQQAAIDAVIADMTSDRPTDRLVCGDVGFGKTEVAMRAAFVAVQAGRQVAILVPTTLLAQQHYETFKDRFSDWPVQVEVLSRFKTGKEQTKALNLVAEGKIDIVVGTHKLLQESVIFKNLGLIIVDEEHRFGVRHKERLKEMRAEVDMLTLTATPIPRTLNMAMSGVRDMSIIATPPAKRLSIKTFVREENKPVIKEAILRELLRGGQVYFLHNEVKSIERRAEEIQKLVPEARIVVAHGQMRERELEQVMSDFYHKRYNLLMCTTIIETGIDVPSANTIIIDRADKFGLAQLHQLRGRVGRSHHQAYAYLLTPNPKAITADARKRLEAIAEAHDLGAGFTLASHDLEIRGAGELLGEEQSGNMNSIGFSLYMELLEEAVQSIKEGKTPNLDKPFKQGAEINLRIPALITDDYLRDVHTRLITYKRIANAKNDDQLDELRVEMVDRFGSLPESTKNLFRLTRIKLRAQAMGLSKIDAGPRGGRVEFGAETKVHPLTIVKMVQIQPQFYKLDGADKLKFAIESETAEQRLDLIEELLDKLSVNPERK